MRKIYLKLVGVFNSSNNTVLAALMILVIMLSGCSSDLDDLIVPGSKTETTTSGIRSKVSKTDAIAIAEKVLKKDRTRSGILNIPKFEYVMGGINTRSTSTSDTLAYILNYPDNGGFVIVSTDRRVYPVLAFAHEGQFTLDNENARVNFIDRIGTYIEETPEDTLYDVGDSDFKTCYDIHPIVGYSLDQRAPWDKYVIQEHPGCPVGCVAVATALVMSYSKSQISYHNSLYYLKSIITAINKGPDSTPANLPKRIEGGIYNPTYTYEQAVDSMARLLYWIGKDVDMSYGSKGSGAKSEDAYELCKSLSYSIPSGYVTTFDIKKVAQYIIDNHIIYIGGNDINGGGGHAWVIDGCYCCLNEDRTEIVDPYIHCDWGTGGYCNGYYSGAVFAMDKYNFKPTEYFAVKREWN